MKFGFMARQTLFTWIIFPQCIFEAHFLSDNDHLGYSMNHLWYFSIPNRIHVSYLANKKMNPCQFINFSHICYGFSIEFSIMREFSVDSLAHVSSKFCNTFSNWQNNEKRIIFIIMFGIETGSRVCVKIEERQKKKRANKRARKRM